MLRSITKRGIYLVAFLLTSVFAFGQVTVDINSGNPKFPFPQFLSYDFEGAHSLGNLATTNAPGVVHAEMEQIIRDAWQIEANRYNYTGDSWAGVNYILTNIGCPYDCSEGVGYALIAAAYMGDKKTFDGIWMREHDVRRALQPSYRTGAIIRTGYQYGDNTIAEPGGDAATDGDVDIALGLLMAWKQWGDNSGYMAFNGSPISYKKEALDVIRGLVERKNRGFMSGSVADCRSVSGNVGFDGYLKNGNTGPGETTTFGSGDPLWCPEFGGPNKLHIDYAAPAYFYSFRDVMASESMDPWEINQMYRAEASSDWIMGKLLDNPAGVPHAGWADVNGSNVTFSSFNLGEDFRAAWRTILNYVWHGDPDYTWDPVTHTVKAGVPNSFEQLIGKRFTSFVADQRKAPWGNPCKDLGGGPDLTYTGPPITSVQYDPNTGAELFPLPINWGMATSAPSTIAAQDYGVMGDMFRQCAIEWDITSAGDRYLTSKPVYFHGFFRLLGMLILSGNFQDPLVAKPIANVKIYRAVDKTFGYTNDQFQFTLSYRNYGTVAATGVKIVETLPNNFIYVSSTNGGVYDPGSNTITWNIAGGVPGFSSAGGIAPTQGVRSYILKAGPNASGRYCATATISASNSKSWTTNEYPNNITEVMERNCIDIVKRALLIEKSVNYSTVQNNTEVKFKINFENSSTAGWINGGRPNVYFSYAQGTYAATGDTRGIKIRLFHGAAEPYVNYKNYRISVFLNDNTYTCVNSVGPCTFGWALRNTIYEGGASTGVTFTQESITPGSDARGKWNQRVIIQFADQIATTTPQLSAMYGMAARIHQGGTEPLRAVWDLYTSNYGAIDWSDDWSWNATAAAPDGDKYFPVTNDWTDPYNLNIPVTKWHKDACEVAAKTVDNVLIEEWDGYVWRRAYGNGPLPGRDVANVIIRDTLPVGLAFSGWVQQTTLGITATYNPANRVITWTIPKLQVGQKGTLEYKAIATFTTAGTCPKADQTHINSSWIEGDSESKIADTAKVTVTCDDVILPPVPTTMTKTADKTAYVVGDPINYTIAYTQTHGAIIDASMSTASEWNQQIGTWNFGTKLSNATQNSPSLIVHNKAHGTNGTITGTLQLAASANFAIALRQSGTTIASASYVTFKANPGGGVIDIGVWNGTTLLQSQSIGYPGPSQDFKIVLNGAQLNLWVGSLTGTPTLTVTGLTVKAGYIGFLNGNPSGADNWATHSVVSLHSEMDSAYDIVISDPIPTGITFGTATGGTNTAGVVSWPSIAGPVLYGTVITKTWTGTVTTCAPSGKIVNNAYANMLGQATNSIAAQSIVTCGGTNPCVKPTISSAAIGTVCSGVAQNYTITSVVPSSYSWSRALVTGITNAGVTAQTANPIAEVLTNSTTAAVVVRYVITPTSTTGSCVGTAFNYDVTVNPKPTISSAAAGTVCSGVAQNYTITSVVPSSYSWSRALVTGITNAAVTAQTANPIAEVLTNSTTAAVNVVYTITPTSTTGTCAGTPFTYTVTVNPAPTISSASTGTICSGVAQNYTITSVVPSTYSWSRAAVVGITNAAVTAQTANPITETLTNSTTAAVSVVYTITPTSTTGTCAGPAATYTVVVNPKPVISSSATGTVCSDVAQNYAITSVVPSSYSWSRAAVTGITNGAVTAQTANPIAEILTNSTTAAVNVVYTITPTSTTGTCAGTPFTYTVTVNPKPAISSAATGSVCSGVAQNYTITSAVASSYSWSRTLVTGITNGAVTAQTANPIAETLSNSTTAAVNVVYTITPTSTTGTCVGTPFTYTVTVNPAPTISSSGTGTVCSGVAQNYTITSVIPSTYSWSRALVTGVTNGAVTAQSANPITETLTNSTTAAVNAVYTITPTATTGTCAGIPFTYTVTVNPKPTISSVSTGSVCSGVAQNYTITSAVASSYSWSRAAVAGITNAANPTGTGTPITEILTNSTTAAVNVVYTITPTSTAGTCAGTPFTYTVTVNPKPSITSAISGTICTGVSVNYLITSDVASSYSWSRAAVTGITNAANTGTSNPIAESLTSTATGPVVVRYVIIPTSTSGTCAGASFNYDVTVSATAPAGVVLTPAPGTTICAGTAVTFTATATNGGTPTYVWTSSVQGPLSSSTNIFTSGSSSSGTPLVNGEVITVKMTSSLGCASPVSDTKSVTMVVNANVTPSVTAAITAPTGTICPGASVTFTATPTNEGAGPKYQWYKGAVPGSGSLISGETNATYSTTGALNGDNYYVELTSNATCASPTQVNSTPVSVTVAAVPAPTVSIISDKTSICSGNPVVFTATPGGTGITTPAPSYQWYIGSAAISGETNATFTTSSLSDATPPITPTHPGNDVHVTIVSNATCTNNTASSSTPITITVNPGVLPGSISTGSSFCSGTTPGAITELTAATGITASATYTWEQNTASAPNPPNWVTAVGTPTNSGKGFTPGGTVTTDISYRRTVTDLTLPSACQAATTNAITYTVIALPSISSASSGTICSGIAQNYTITSAIASSYVWSRGTVSGITNAAISNQISNPITETLVNTTSSAINVAYSIVPTSTTGSCTGATFTYTVTVNPLPKVTATPAESGIVCSGVSHTYTITSDIAATYSWTRASVNNITPATGSGTSSSITETLTNQTIGTATPADITVYYVITPISSAPASCVGPQVTYPLTVAVAAVPTVSVTANKAGICAGVPVKYTATGTATGGSPTYQWYQSSAANPAGIPVGTNSTTYTTTDLALSTDKVWVEMTSNFPCIAVGAANPAISSPVSIEVKQAPKPQIETDQVICSADGGFVYTATNLQANSTLQWQLNAQNISKATDLTYNATQSGLYTVVEDNGYCTGGSSASKLTIVPTPDPYAGSDMYVTEGTFVQLQAGGGITGTTYNWTPPTGLNSTTVSNPSFKADNTITYTVTLTNTDAASGHKCFADASVTITVVKPIVVPNVITINGDGNNDTWHIQHIEGYPNATFEIYNRWGNLVWKSTGYPKEWDGTNFRNGEVLPDGTYFYIINLHSQIFTEPYTGWIQIVK